LRFSEKNKTKKIIKDNKLCVFFLVAILIGSSVISKTFEQSVMEIKDGWKFRMISSEQWFDAKVPGCIHTDLLENGLIPDPFYRDNEAKLQWVDKVPCEYKTTFKVDKSILDRENIELYFKGLDTYADVYVNEQLVLSADNMFIEWRVDVKKVLEEGENELRIYFHSPFYRGLMEMEKHTDKLPTFLIAGFGVGNPPSTSTYTRKAPYQYGWDWGPVLTTSGIWRNIYLRAWDNARINYLQIVQKELTDEKASLSAVFEIEATSPQEVVLNLSYKLNNIIKKVKPVKTNLKKGVNFVAVDFEIANPELWWPSGMGAHPVYEFTGSILLDSKVIDNIKTRYGLRTAKVIQTTDGYGTSFYFEINGVPVFAKGANYIPCDIFPSRVIGEHYEELIQVTVLANMNMLRIWGGGIYEDDIFYDLCDEHGIMVWQDFMVACYSYPGHEEFLKSVEQEAIDNVKRLRNHPSIVIWCGNNEIDMIFNGFIKQMLEQRAPEIAAKAVKAYDDLFYTIIPEVCKEYDDSRFYWPSSPCGGWRVQQNSQSGDMHYWGVWHQDHTFNQFNENMSRFFSEWGFQSYPEFKTVEEFTVPEDWDVLSHVMKSHQKSVGGNEKIDTYLRMYYNTPKDFKSYLYVTQVMQAEAGKLGIETHRRNKPYTMGTLYWQLNDCWPVASWASLDYKNRWKALHYYAKKAYSNVLPIVSDFQGNFKVQVVSDILEPIKAELQMKIIDFKGKEVWRQTVPVEMDENTCKTFFEKKSDEFLKGIDRKNTVFVVRLVKGKQVISSNIFYLAPFKDLNFPQPNITKKITKTTDGYKIKLATDKLVKNLYMSIDEDGFFSDNFFDMLPGEELTINFKSKQKVDNLEQKLKIISLVDTY
jgi:beta-mannosidase